MSKYLVETFYTCSFKVKHFLDKIDQKELNNLEKRDDGEFEIIDVKIDTRKTKSLEKNSTSKNKANLSEVKIDKNSSNLDSKSFNLSNLNFLNIGYWKKIILEVKEPTKDTLEVKIHQNDVLFNKRRKYFARQEKRKSNLKKFKYFLFRYTNLKNYFLFLKKKTN